MEDLKTIRKALNANCGGLESATDEQVRYIWQNLPADARDGYLKKAAGGEVVVPAEDKNKKKD